jgi:hypothetical protein
MARWQEMEDSAPEFARALAERLDAHTHKTIATLRKDGSPRISGIEAFVADGDLWIGSMPNAVKAQDLQRDPRYALHSGSADPPEWPGDAKLSGSAEEIIDQERRRALAQTMGSDSPPSPDSHTFRLDIDEAVLVGLNDERTKLIVQLWRPDAGVTRFERD